MVKKPRNVDFDLGRRTPAERLWLARKAAGLTQVQAAQLAGVGENAYGDAEKGRSAAVRGPVPGIPGVRRPTLAQLLALARRRWGGGLAAVASEAGFCRVWYLAKERAGSRALKLHWEGLGFTFPRK